MPANPCVENECVPLRSIVAWPRAPRRARSSTSGRRRRRRPRAALRTGWRAGSRSDSAPRSRSSYRERWSSVGQSAHRGVSAHSPAGWPGTDRCTWATVRNPELPDWSEKSRLVPDPAVAAVLHDDEVRRLRTDDDRAAVRAEAICRASRRAVTVERHDELPLDLAGDVGLREHLAAAWEANRKRRRALSARRRRHAGREQRRRPDQQCRRQQCRPRPAQRCSSCTVPARIPSSAIEKPDSVGARADVPDPAEAAGVGQQQVALRCEQLGHRHRSVPEPLEHRRSRRRSTAPGSTSACTPSRARTASPGSPSPAHGHARRPAEAEPRAGPLRGGLASRSVRAGERLGHVEAGYLPETRRWPKPAAAQIGERPTGVDPPADSPRRGQGERGAPSAGRQQQRAGGPARVERGAGRDGLARERNLEAAGERRDRVPKGHTLDQDLMARRAGIEPEDPLLDSSSPSPGRRTSVETSVPENGPATIGSVARRS